MIEGVSNNHPYPVVNLLPFTLILSLYPQPSTCKNPAANMKPTPMTSDQKQLVIRAKPHQDWCDPEYHLQHISLETEFRQKFRTASQAR